MKKFDVQNKAGRAKIAIIGGIDWWENNSKDFTTAVDQLLDSGVTDLDLYINTPGGDMFDANEIGNQIKRFSGEKIAKTGALVASAGTVILTYCDKVIAASNLQWMCHDPMVSPLIMSLDDWESNKQLYVNLRNDLIDRYHAVTGIEKEELAEMMRKTTWLNAKEALKKGFVSEIDTEEQSMPEDTSSVLNKLGVNVPANFLNTNQVKPTNNKMKQLLAKYGLPENATEEQLTNAIEADKTKSVDEARKTATPANQGGGKTTEPEKPNGPSNSALELLLDAAENKGFNRDTIKASAEKDFELTFNLVKGAPEKTTENGSGDDGTRISDVVNALKQNGGLGGAPKNEHEGKSFSQLSKDAPAYLDNLLKNDLKKYKELYKNQFGVEPSDADLKV